MLLLTRLHVLACLIIRTVFGLVVVLVDIHLHLDLELFLAFTVDAIGGKTRLVVDGKVVLKCG